MFVCSIELMMYDHDPVTITIYASKNGLLDTPRWQLPGLKKLAKSQKRLLRMAKQAKLQSFRTKPVYMYGFLIPQNHEQAMQPNKENGNTLWLNDSKVWVTDIRNAYLESLTQKKVYIIAGPKFGKCEGHTLLINKAL